MSASKPPFGTWPNTFVTSEQAHSGHGEPPSTWHIGGSDGACTIFPAGQGSNTLARESALRASSDGSEVGGSTWRNPLSIP